MLSGPTRLRRDRRPRGHLAGLVAVLLVGSLLATVGRGSATGPIATAAAVTTASAGCSDALIVGVNGDREPRVHGRTYGATVDSVVRRVVTKARANGRTVVVKGVALPTRGPAALLRTPHRPTSYAVSALSRHAVHAWRSPVAGGVQAARSLLTTAAARCPDRPVLLVGYGQGAAVVHRVLSRLGDAGALAGLVGGILISDPDRVGRSVARPVQGDPPAPGRHSGVFARVLGPTADVPAAQGSYGVWSVCSRYDLVCDPSVHATVRTSVAVAGSYARSAALRSVAAQAWQQLALWPVPTPRYQVLTGMVGQPVDVQLAVAPGTHGTVVWTDATGLPPGLALSTGGLLSGTPTRSGTYAVTYRTSNAQPTTTGHTGSLLLKITPASVTLSAGGQTTCVTRSDGTARCWGRNDYGQVGDGTTTGRATPVKVLGTGWSTISTSGSSTCGVKQNGTLWCWGLDNYGQVGIGVGSPVHRPHQVGTSRGWATVATSWTHTCAVRRSGALYCWGQNLWGQLGIGSVDRDHARPVRIGTSSDWRSVALGGWHSCALTTAGEAFCWGHNSFGEVGDGSTATRSAPVRVAGGATWLQLSAAWAQTCGITQTGEMRCWGFNRQGQLGDGTLTNRARPTLVTGGQTWTQVSMGDGSTCATGADARLWCWGDDRYGQLGDAGSAAPDPVPTQVAALPDPVQLTSSGWLHTCAIPVGGQFTCWGNDETGQLGDGGVQTVRTLPSLLHAGTAGSAALPRPQVALHPRDLPSERFLDHAAPRRIAEAAVASRPSLAAADRSASGRTGRRAALTPFKIMTINMLGSQHTAPGGDEPNMAPGRIRAEWASTYVGMRGASLVGMQEPQPDQIVALQSATRGRFTVYPGNSLGYDGAPQSVMWDNTEWQLTWHSSISIPFTSGWRPQPIVELQQRSTGAKLYWINVHFSARRAHQAQRDKAMRILIPAIRALKGDGLPIMLTGDFNEVAPAFCAITGRTPLIAANGGSNVGGHCLPPKGARIDWIFGSRGTFSRALMDDSAQVRRTTDHHVLSALFRTP